MESSMTSTARQAVVSPGPADAARQERSGLLRRQSACGNHAYGECEARKRETGGLVQRSVVDRGRAGEAPAIVHEVLRSPGRSLDTATRSLMEPRLGHNLSGVRVHSDQQAARSARAVGARAYTVGHDVVFDSGQYAPDSNVGQSLLSHELTHVVQQGNTAWTGGDLEIGAVDTPQEHEARNAIHAESGRAPGSLAGTVAPRVVQREGGPDLGGFFVRLREDGRIEFLAQTPDLPGTGPLGAGLRCQNGRCQFVGGQKPSDLGNRTYTLQEALDLLRGSPTTPPSSATSCPPDRQIRQIPGACCPAGMVADGLTCRPLTAGPQICLPQQMTPRGTCCPPGERWDFLANRCAPPSPIIQPGERTPQLTLPPLLGEAGRPRFGTIESSTFDNFQSDDATMPSQHSAALDHLASLLNIYREVEVHIEGHTDSTASEAHNQRLSENRAGAVRAALVARSVVNPGRLLTEGFGERQLRNRPERTEADKAGNRRVEVWFYVPPAEGLGSQLRLRSPLGPTPGTTDL
jgi:outer membrane protein OmpA-like peptidoglycan-associated protein